MTRLFILQFLLISSTLFSQKPPLNQLITEAISNKKALVGVSIYNFDTQKWYGQNENNHFPLQSVFKFHIALAIFDEIEKGKLNLPQKIYISKKEMQTNLYSPLKDKYPQGNIYLPLHEILKATVSESDNVGCDALLKLLGGPKKINTYLKKIGMKDVQILYNEIHSQKVWERQFSNWTSPASTVELLKAFQNKEFLTEKSHLEILKMLNETSTGPKRLKGLLPEGTTVAHKTGTSGTNSSTGIMAAVNDIGIVTLPNGDQYAIAVFVSQSKESLETNERIIAEISKIAYDFFKKDTN
jgi:beta-lactamase class A